MIARTIAAAGALMLLLASTPGLAPARADAAAELRGRVQATNGTPLSGVQITITGTGIGALSGLDGRYALRLGDAWAGREVVVEARLIGYAPARHIVTLSGAATTLDFALQPTRADLEEKILTGAVASDAAIRRAAGAAAVRETHSAPPGDRESYAYISENAYRAVRDHPLSTFSIDVDRASYANVRRFLSQGRRPPIDAVRIEELINYFPYGDAAPEGEDPFSVSAEIAPAPWQPLHRLVRIGLKARDIDMDEAPANNLVFLLDVSGSMNQPDKLPLLKTAFSMLVDRLRPQDRVAIVVYAGAAGLVLPSTAGNERGDILEALQSLEAGGSTAGGAGIQLAYTVAAEHHIEGGNNRVILATDGDFNVGASSDSEMIRLIEEKREQGTFLTVLGFGTGNLQDAKMEQIADHGNGNFAYIDSALEAKKVLVTEMGGTLVTVAKDVKIQVEFNPDRVAAYRLIGYENRLLAAEDFNDDRKDAGELGAGHSVTALYEIVPTGVESPVAIPGVDPLRYQRPSGTPRAAATEEVLFVKLRYKEPDGGASRLMTHPVVDEVSEARTSDDFRFAAAVAAWGMLLRESEHCSGFSLDDVARLARGALGADAEGYRAEFLGLVDRARSLDLLEMRPGLR